MSNNPFYNKQIPFRNRISFNCRFIIEHFFGKTFLKKRINKWGAKNINNINNELSKLDASPMLKIDTYDSSISPKLFREKYINKGEPLLIKGGAKNWEAVEKWDYDFFKNNYGDHSVILTNRKELGDDSNKETEFTTLKHIIDGLDKESKKYARFNPLLDQHPELVKSFDTDWLNNVIIKKSRNHHALFIGNKNTKTNIHNAADENIFVQVRGKKKWLIWDHQAIYGIAPPVNRAPAKASSTNPYKGNETYYGFTRMPKYEVELEEGDILYIPSYLWHYVENKTASIGVAIRWISPKNAIKNLPLLAFLEIFNTSPSIFKIMNFDQKKNDFNKILQSIKKEQLKQEKK